MNKNIKQIILNDQTLNIKKFEFDNTLENNIFTVIGKRKTGKTSLCMDLVKNIKNIKNNPYEIIITNKDELLCEEILKNLIDRQYTMYKNGKFKDAEAQTIVLLDDCIINNKMNHPKSSFFQLLINGRHYKNTTIFTMQYPVILKPELRVNYDYIFLLADDNIQNIKKIYDTFGGFFKTFEEFKTVFLELTKDFSAMVIVNNGNYGDITKKIFWYKVNECALRNF